MSRDLLLLSTTTVYGSSFMDYCIDDVADHFQGLKEIAFVPYARPGGISHDEYTNIVQNRLKKIGIEVKGVHELENPKDSISSFGAVYIGGGNTFLLLKDLYSSGLIESVRKEVLNNGMKYMGSSAGTNVACKAINNTNDMPIVYPPSFEALGLIPFNINPHYLDPDPNSKHKGETRETRINEFHFQSSIPVVGLREGSLLKIDDNKVSIGGKLPVRLFTKGNAPKEIAPEEDLSFLLS